MQLLFVTSNDEGFTKEEIAARALRARLYRRSGLMREWLYNPETILHIVLVITSPSSTDLYGGPIAVGMIHVDRTISLYVRGKYRKQGIGSKLIQALLSMTAQNVIGRPDWDRPYDYNGGFWDKMTQRNSQIKLG